MIVFAYLFYSNKSVKIESIKNRKTFTYIIDQKKLQNSNPKNIRHSKTHRKKPLPLKCNLFTKTILKQIVHYVP